MLILGAVGQKLGMAMQNSAWKLSTACTLGTFVGKESHFKIYAYAPVKPGNYETPPTEHQDWPHPLTLTFSQLQSQWTVSWYVTEL